MDYGSNGGFCEPCAGSATANDCDGAGFIHELGTAECYQVCAGTGKIRPGNGSGNGTEKKTIELD